MPVLTATEVTIYSGISASAPTVASSGIISIVQDRLTQILNSYFVTDIMVNASCDFSGSTITLRANNWETFGFAAGDEVYIKNSYRNDGYVTIASITSAIATLATGSTVVAELSGRSVLFSVVKWPLQVKKAAALMAEYDYDTRPERDPGVKSYSLGPFSESYGDEGRGGSGYPKEILDMLPPPTVSMI